MRKISMFLQVGFVLVALSALPAAGNERLQSLGWDDLTSSVCIYDRSSSRECVPIGTIDSSGHSWAPKVGGVAITATTGTGSTAVLSEGPTLSGTVSLASGGKIAIGGTDVLGVTAVMPHGASAFTKYLLAGSSTNYLDLYDYGGNRTSIVGLNADEGIGVTGGARTSTNASTGDLAIGIAGFGFCDGGGVTAGNPCWGGYLEARAWPGTTGHVAGGEVNATNLRGSVVDINPYAPFNAGSTLGFHIASGGDCRTGRPCYNPATGVKDLIAGTASAALLLSTNPTDFKQGIVAGCGLLHGTDCAGNGAGNVFSTYVGTNFAWFNPSGAQVFTFGSANTSLLGQLGWSNSGLTLGNGTSTLFQIYPGAGAVNGMAAVAAAAGGSPTWSAIGADTDIEMKIRGKGARGVTVDRLAVDGSAPTISACGASPSVWGNASSNGGAFRTGSDGPSSCTVTFAKSFPGNAFCTVTPAGGSWTGTYRVSTPSPTGFTLTLSAAATSQWFNYTCLGG